MPWGWWGGKAAAKRAEEEAIGRRLAEEKLAEEERLAGLERVAQEDKEMAERLAEGERLVEEERRAQEEAAEAERLAREEVAVNERKAEEEAARVAAATEEQAKLRAEEEEAKKAKQQAEGEAREAKLRDARAKAAEVIARLGAGRPAAAIGSSMRGPYSNSQSWAQVDVLLVPHNPPCSMFAQLGFLFWVFLWLLSPELYESAIRAAKAWKEGQESLGRVAPQIPNMIHEWACSWHWWVVNMYRTYRYRIVFETNLIVDDMRTWVRYFRTGDFYNPHGEWVVPVYKKVYNYFFSNPLRYLWRQIYIPMDTLGWIIKEKYGMASEWEWVQWTWRDSGEMGWEYAEGLDVLRKEQLDLATQGKRAKDLFGDLNSLPSELIVHIRNFLHPGWEACLFQKVCPEIYQINYHKYAAHLGEISPYENACEMCGVWDRFWLAEGVEKPWVTGVFCSYRCMKMSEWEEWENPDRY